MQSLYSCQDPPSSDPYMCTQHAWYPHCAVNKLSEELLKYSLKPHIFVS